MLWLIVIIFSYLLFSITALIDKHLLTNYILNAKVYAFYVGLLSVSALVLSPLGFSIPEPFEIALALLAGAVFILAVFSLYSALIKFEVSRVVPCMGGILPFFTLGLVVLFSQSKEILTFEQCISFCVLIAGSVLIVFEKKKNITLASLQISALTAFFFSLSFVLSKLVYMSQPFWSGFIWMRLGGFLAALFFLFSKEVREELFTKRKVFRKKTAKIFLLNQALGGSASMLQNWAIALVPLASLAFLNALEGVKYVFLLLFAVLLSFRFPKILREKMSQKILFQKIFAILLIGVGIVILAIF